jgi:predicted esterase
VDFPHIDWRALQDVYGWPALQWQGWARGEVNVRGSGTISLALHTLGALEVWVDGEQYFGGDFYSYGRAAVSLHLAEGSHKIDVRLARDVRANGGVGRPSVNVKIRLQALGPLLTPVRVDTQDPTHDALLPDIIGGPFGSLASRYASITLRNDGHDDAEIVGIEASRQQCLAELVSKQTIRFVPGQTRPVAIRIACVPPVTGRGPVRFSIMYRQANTRTAVRSAWVYAVPTIRELHEPQKITYLHPGGIVSYAILRPPSESAHCEHGHDVSAPVLLALHGAGLEADNDLVRHALDELPNLCSWVLFPTGVTPWSGDDWHTWGFADVEAAIAAIATWIEDNNWEGPGVDVDHWIVAGHSNGGQGAWYALTHRLDKVVAAAPLSGYSSLQNYVPYDLWRIADPGTMAVVQSALLNYRHELLLENAKGIPILQQHGQKDDNVPPFHSRLLSQLIEQAGATSEYHEMPNEPHYWPGVMTTDPLKHFFRSQLNSGAPAAEHWSLDMPDYTVVSAGHGDMGPKNGVNILQLLTPGQLGRLHVTRNFAQLACMMQSSNVLSFTLASLYRRCGTLCIDSQCFAELDPLEEKDMLLIKHEGKWTIDASSLSSPPRQGRQLGPMESILRTQGAFYIVYLSPAAKDTALQISRNLCQYYGADTIVTDDYEAAKAAPGASVITVALNQHLPDSDEAYSPPISVSTECIKLVDIDHSTRTYKSHSGLGTIFLRPLKHDRLELVVWGADEEGLAIAARLTPLLTGTGQPDFVVTDRSMLWKGIEGTLAMGFFDSWWNVSRNSFLT